MATPAQLGAVKTLIESAPDAALRSLAMALTSATVGPMAPIREMVEGEQRERGLRDAVFGPVVPLFSARADGMASLQFPSRVLSSLWRSLKPICPTAVGDAAEAYAEQMDLESDPPAYNEICAAAAALLREQPDAFFRAGEGDRGAAEQLAAFLDLAPVARQVLRRLPEWLGKATDERIAALKLMFRDATAVAVDATPRLLELVLSHLPEPATILRLIAIITDRAGDRYLASSELAPFGVRLLDDVDRRVTRIKTFDAQGGADAARAAARDVVLACSTMAELEQCVELSRDGPWGTRVTALRKSLAVNVESRLREVEASVGPALPLPMVKIAGRMPRPPPRLSADPDPRHVNTARGLLVLLEETRSTAAVGGYGALRNAVAEKVAERVNVYADELLTLVNAGEAPDEERAQAYLEIAAEFVAYAQDEKAAQIIRRRAAVAGERQTSQDGA